MYSSTQKSFLTCGFGAGFNVAIGFGGIFISGLNPIGGGSNVFIGVFSARCVPFVFMLSLRSCLGGGGGGAGGPVGNT